MPDLLERLRAALADRYTVESEIGRGGMAVVFRAEDLKHRRKVAIKVLHPDLTVTLAADRFLNEIQVVASLEHPHILTLIDSGEVNGLLYYIMPYVRGESLRGRLDRDSQLPVEEAVRIAVEVADGLDYAHQEGVIHRDVKPGNILLSHGHAVITDFGIARAISVAQGERVTSTGLGVGTPLYASPEQATGAQTLDGRTDTYSLGCMLYEMLSGQVPLAASTPQGTQARRMSETPAPVHSLRDTVPPLLDRVIAKALARLPADRWDTADLFGQALMTATMDAPPVASLDLASTPELGSVAESKRKPLAWALMVAIGVLAVSAVAVVSWTQANDRASTQDADGPPQAVTDRDPFPYLGLDTVIVLPFAVNTGDGTQGMTLAFLFELYLTRRDSLPVVEDSLVHELLRQAGRTPWDRIPEDVGLEIASESGARRMIRGSVDRQAENFRVYAELIDVNSGTVVGTDKASGSSARALADTVSLRLAAHLTGESAVRKQWLEASNYVAQGRYADALGVSRSALQKAIELERGELRLQGLAIVAYYAQLTGAYEEAEEVWRELLYVDEWRRWAACAILSIYGRQGRFGEMVQVRDLALQSALGAPESGSREEQSFIRTVDGLLEYYRTGDAEEAARLFDQAREITDLAGTAILPGTTIGGEEVLALIEVGRGLDALRRAEGLESSGYPSYVHTAWYLQSRAYRAIGERGKSYRRSKKLRELFGDRIEEVLLFSEGRVVTSPVG